MDPEHVMKLCNTNLFFHDLHHYWMLFSLKFSTCADVLTINHTPYQGNQLTRRITNENYFLYQTHSFVVRLLSKAKSVIFHSIICESNFVRCMDFVVGIYILCSAASVCDFIFLYVV